MRLYRLSALLVLLAFLASSAALPATAAELAPTEAAALDRILALTGERLTVAPMVAQSKWNSGAPVNVPEREAQILDRVTERAAEAGVEPAFARAFFQAQFEAGKVIQAALHEQWRAEGRGPFDKAPDLAEDVRPLLDRLTPQIVEALEEVQRIAPGAEALAYLREQAVVRLRGEVDGKARAEAIAPIEARLAP